MKLNFKTLCACLALVMYAENLMADEKDFQGTSSQLQKKSTDWPNRSTRNSRSSTNDFTNKNYKTKTKKDFQSTSSQSQKKSTDSRGQKRKMPPEVLNKWMKAAYEGDIETIHSYIDKSYDVNVRGKHGKTA